MSKTCQAQTEAIHSILSVLICTTGETYRSYNTNGNENSGRVFILKS